MNRAAPLSAVVGIISATTVLAHSGVTNPDVKARMELMERISDATKVIGNMAMGRMTYEAATAQKAGRALADHAMQIPQAFEARVTDPKSEARATIWDDFSRFSAQADTLAKAAGKAAEATDATSLKSSFPAVARTCRSCHEAFRD